MLLRGLRTIVIFILLGSVSWGQAPLDVRSYTGRIELDMASQILQGKVRLVISSGDPLQELTQVNLHLHSLKVDSAWVNAIPHVYEQTDEVVRIDLPVPVPPSDSVVVDLVYSGSPTPEAGSPAWGGFFWGEPTFTMGVGFYAPYVSMTRHWLPCNDVPADKATFDLTFVVPEDFVVAGTGLLASEQRFNGKAAWRWVENHPTATYLVTLAADRYAVVRSSWKGMPLDFYVRPSDTVRARTYFLPLFDMLQAFTDAYGPYPFDKVGYCITPIGSMEHQTMVSLAEAVFYSEVEGGATVAHELAHQWWGNSVSVKSFADAWLSEGFATFSEAVYQEFVGGHSNYLRTARQFSAMYKNFVVPSEGLFPLYDFPRTPPSSNYPQTIYQKGAAVLVMLRLVVGDSAFFEGMKTYGRTYAYGNATTEDFRRVMEATSGQSLDWFFNQWVHGVGFPRYILERFSDAADQPLRVRLLQTQSEQFFRMPFKATIILTNRDTIRSTILNDAVESQVFTFPDITTGSVKGFYIDYDGLVLKVLTTRTVSAEQTPASPTGGLLLPVWPNPASNIVHVPVSLAARQSLRLEIRDQLGRLHAVLADEVRSPGNHLFPVDLTSYSRGMYFVRLSTAEGIQQVLLHH